MTPSLLAPAAAALMFGLAACSAPSADTHADRPATETAEAVQTAGAGAETETFALSLSPVIEELEYPWGLAFLPNGDMLVTEREGRLNLVSGTAKTVISGTPEALVDGQGGYLGLTLDPDFATNRTLYMAYSDGTKAANSTAVMKAVLSADGTQLSDVTTIYTADRRDTSYHFGGRLQFMTDGTLLVTLGDGFKYMQDAQSYENTHGTIVRINSDGTVPSDNPFVGTPEASEQVFTYGHRNVQGLFVDQTTGTVYAHEHGPKGGDELNILQAGTNYGWPAITYGIGYDDAVISEFTEKEGMEQPQIRWVPSIAPSGMIRYTGDKYPGWTGDLIIGAMNGPAGQKLVRVDMDGESIGDETYYLEDAARPIRDIAQGPDGYLYVLTHEFDGGLYRLDIR